LALAVCFALVRAEALTAANQGLLLTVAVSYSAQADIAAAARRLAQAAADGRIRPDDVTPDLLARELSTAPTTLEVGPVDLLIRTSDTQRLSNFLLWELAYAELYFEPALWPAFGEEQLVRALRQYAGRERRFGGRH
jgi:undecaprenyl diphosphate synthase